MTPITIINQIRRRRNNSSEANKVRQKGEEEERMINRDVVGEKEGILSKKKLWKTDLRGSHARIIIRGWG